MISTLEMLHDWKASDFSLDSVEASIYAMWNMIFFGKFFASIIPEDEVRLKLFDFYQFDDFMENTIQNLHHNASYLSNYCLLPGEQSHKTACTRNLVVSLKEALDFLKSEFGEDKKEWQW